VRRYLAWYRHVTLALLARAFLAVTAAWRLTVLNWFGPDSVLVQSRRQQLR
jgi:hypothetical protein